MKKAIYKKKDLMYGLICCLPPVIGISLFTVVPLIFSLVLSFGQLSSFDLFDVKFDDLPVALDDLVHAYSLLSPVA